MTNRYGPICGIKITKWFPPVECLKTLTVSVQSYDYFKYEI